MYQLRKTKSKMSEFCLYCQEALEFYEKEICFECEESFYDESFEDAY